METKGLTVNAGKTKMMSGVYEDCNGLVQYAGTVLAATQSCVLSVKDEYISDVVIS